MATLISFREAALGVVLIGGIGLNLAPDQEYKLYRGLLHAHTMISDGSGTPREAFEMARSEGLDFFAVTPHNHSSAEFGAKERTDGVLIANTRALYNGTEDVDVRQVWKKNDKVIRTNDLKVTPLLKVSEELTDDSFLALYGQEFSTISSGNHMNVIGVKEVLDVSNGNFKGLVGYLKTLSYSPVLQMNHPNVQQDLFYGGSNSDIQDKMFNDYGVDEGDIGSNFKDLVTLLDPYVNLIEILSGPAMKKEPMVNYIYGHTHENDYFFYLKQGFHLSPSVGQDNHYKTWGKTTDARTGVYAINLTEDALFDAFRNHRTFASEDKNLSVKWSINNYFMGSKIKLNAGDELNMLIELSDEDEPNATYEVIIYGGEINSEESKMATNWKASDGKVESWDMTGNGTAEINGVFTSGKPEFYYVKVEQSDDNRLWTAPIWINYDFTPAAISTSDAEATVVFFWTKSANSEVYHVKGCSSIRRIKSENLESGSTPPTGRREHQCSIEEEVGH